MKRSCTIGLVLLGGVAAGGLAGCGSGEEQAPARISTDSVYENDFFVAGVGYYHAPFHQFYPFRYNSYDALRRQYYAGGTWSSAPFQSVINLSSPTPDAARQAEAGRTDIRRGGFGGTAGGYSIWS